MQNSSFKKLAIIGGVFAAILAAVLGFLFFQSSQNDFKTGGGSAVVPTPNSQVVGRLTQFSQNNVSFKYPEYATVEASLVEGGGEAVTLEFDSAIDAIIQLQITAKEANSLSRIDEIFNSLNYQKSEVLMGEGNTIHAILYKGKIDLANTDIQEQVAVFENGDSVYKIQMSYSSNEVNPKAEAAFQAVISTFKL